ncbi:DUF6284 family protein [Streptomyces caniscabiei]|uniref:DUF6284 family protein n=1 Tax=Streptomyces caniscabiei TaxID=2746961 RepID=A0ABU4N2K2_9ACTN|nr:DUF6284 family protein [Streptomyces caniscabiei]MBE4740511.1 hypothetical protein [Streptomyces caniscabiei]MBE4761322.1 hypothetical protein [Streptomyces caniscabiei]MBE4773473.1 hypothetical protein [Streptomyces caniscabiei]MBE4790080.1 hypothetical protein [Streptomyces caniscabiei]MBE4799332.1 hypothetical protein [Streptomyces caniscabiei]
MKHIGAVQAVVTAADDFDREPTLAELDALAVETPLIDAEVELLDVRISLLDCTPTEVDHQRIRRARRKVLAARRGLANRAAMVLPGVGA